MDDNFTRETARVLTKDTVFIRTVILGVLDLLDKTIIFKTDINDNETKITNVPFFFNFGAGDERFLQNFYYNSLGEPCDKKQLDGQYDPIPMGIFKLEGIRIDTAAMTNKYERSLKIEKHGDELKTFAMHLNQLPLSFSFSCEVRTDSLLDSFRVVEQFWEKFYRVHIVDVSWNYSRIECQLGFSEDVNIDKLFEWTFSNDAYTSVTFSMELETYYPLYDETTRMENRIKEFNSRDVIPDNFKIPTAINIKTKKDNP